MKEFIREKFSHLFQRSAWIRARLEDNFFVPKLDSEAAPNLTRNFFEAEVRTAIWDCDSSSSPGPDWFNFCFYEACWHIVKDDSMRVLHEFHENGKLVKGSNTSFIVLIGSIKHFSPISLIGSMFKIITKILAERLKSVMSSLIGDSQSAFLKGCNILMESWCSMRLWMKPRK